ncbi:hypothetical protein D3OALGB2SA_4323 [Olavius algarvensis associated proteobacterium Delta 3]|nr:hypothetical protein D3OALGB2SA_4323 [Olavius algarvensis associated proteobacterium Delta 3]
MMEKIDVLERNVVPATTITAAKHTTGGAWLTKSEGRI